MIRLLHWLTRWFAPSPRIQPMGKGSLKGRLLAVHAAKAEPKSEMH